MENAYGVNVANRYFLFLDEDVDPLEILRQQEEASKQKTKKEEKKSTKGKSPASEAEKSTKPAKAKGIKNSISTTVSTDSENKPSKQRQTDAAPNKEKGKMRFCSLSLCDCEAHRWCNYNRNCVQ